MVTIGKKQALAEFHRGTILAAAERLFAEKGIEKTTMDDIAREAEYSKATLYVYFQSKEEITQAIMLNSMALLHRRLRAASESQESWHSAYQAICDAIISFCKPNPFAYEAVAIQLAVSRETAGEMGELERLSSEINRDLIAFLERGVSEGMVQSRCPLVQNTLLFWASLSGIIRTAEQVEQYIKDSLWLDRDGFLRDGVRLLLDTITGVRREQDTKF